MADLLETLLAALAPPSPSYAGAQVPSEDDAMPMRRQTPAPGSTTLYGAPSSPPASGGQGVMDILRGLLSGGATPQAPQPSDDMTAGTALAQPSPTAPQSPPQGGGIRDILKNILSPPDSPNAPHNALRNLFADAPPQPPDGMDAKTMAPAAAPLGGPFPAAAGPAPQPAPAQIPPGMAVAPPGGGTVPANSDVMKKLFESLGGGGGEAAGSPPSGGMDAPRGPAARPGATSSASQAPPGITGEDIVKFIRNVSQGAASVNPRSPKTSAIMQGAAGTLTSDYNESEREKAHKDAQSRQGFEDSLKIRKDSRDEERNADYRKRTNAYEKGVNARTSEQQIRYQDIGAFNTDFRKARDAIGKDVRDGLITKQDGDKRLEAERERLIKQYTTKSVTGVGAAPDAASGSVKPPPPAGTTTTWNGKTMRYDGGSAGENGWVEVK